MKKHGGAPPRTIDFSAPTNPLGPPPYAKLLTQLCLDELERYPNPSYADLVEAVRTFYGFDPDIEVVPMNGAAEAYSLIPLAYGPKYVITLDPTFGDIDDVVESCGAKRLSICMESREGWWQAPRDVEMVLKNVEGKCLAIVSFPNNPTGSHRVLDFVEESRKRCLVVVDTAFLDISSMDKVVDLEDNIVLVHSLTKTLSLPGLRFGFVALRRGNELSKRLELVRQPWNVNSVANCVIRTILVRYGKELANYIELSRSVVSVLREKLVSILKRFGFEVYNSVAPYVLAKLDTMQRVVECLRLMGVYVRMCDTFRCLDTRFARFSVRPIDELEVLSKCLARCLELLSRDLS